MQVHPGELWVSKQRVHIVLEASKSAGAKGDVPKDLQVRAPAAPVLTHSLLKSGLLPTFMDATVLHTLPS